MAQSSNDHWAAVEPVVNRKFYGISQKIPSQFDKIAHVSSDDEPQRSAVEWGGARTLTLKAENAAVQMTTMTQGPVKFWYTQTFAGAATLSHELAKDVKNRFAKLGSAIGQLGEAAHITPELLFALFMDRAFDSNYPATADGVEMCGTHTLPGAAAGTSANELAIPSALDQASLEEVRIALRGIKGPSGNLAPRRIRKLVVPPAYDVIAEKLETTRQSVGDANNDDNVMRGTKSMVFDYLGSSTRWFALTDMMDEENGLFWDWIEKTQFITDQVPLLLQKIYVTYFRARYGIVDWRHVFGVAAT